MTTYGYYYECGTVCEESTDLWTLIETAVKDAVDCDRLHALRAGPMRDAKVGDYFDAEDAEYLLECHQLLASNIVEIVHDRHAETVYDGEAGTDAAGLRAFVVALLRSDDAAERVKAAVEWAESHIQLDPSRYCDGEEPLPIEYHEGEWHFGGIIKEPWASITYDQNHPRWPEEDPSPWRWYTMQSSGGCDTLAEAMRACEAEIARHT